MRLQSLLHAVFPPECLNCGARVEGDFALCGTCWAETPFILGAACDLCGVELRGQQSDGDRLHCDDCHASPPPWSAGRAVMAYADVGRRLVLGLKHGDRAEVARAAGPWMQRAASTLLCDDPVVVPIPLHWQRLAKRRFNQAALLAHALCDMAGTTLCVEGLQRRRATPVQDGQGRDARFANLDGAITPHPRHGKAMAGRAVLLVDDVMTSGATFAVATAACHAAGATKVSVLALARAARET